MTFKEINTKYPIGKLLYRKVEKEKRCAFWASEHDKQIFRAKDPNAEFAWNGVVTYYETITSEKRVEGWLFDGEEWSVVEDTWDGWVVLDEDDLAEYEKIGIATKKAFSF